MAKKHTFWFFVLFFQSNLLTVSAQPCEAPPPDSFRLLAKGPGFVNLGWKPGAPGNLHELKAFRKDEATNNWVVLGTYTHISGSSFLISHPDLGAPAEYQYTVATECENGEASSSLSILGDKLILDLTTPGRQVSNIVAVPCTDITINPGEWVGYMITYSKGTYINSKFEFELWPDDCPTPTPCVQINRLDVSSPIVSASENGEYPNLPTPIHVESSFRFQAKHQYSSSAPYLIGWIGLTVHFSTSPIKIDICPDYNDPINPWDNNYIFTAIKGTTLGFIPETEDREIPSDTEIAVVQNPVIDNIKIFLPQNTQPLTNIQLSVFDLNGRVVLKDNFEWSPIISIQNEAISDLPKGVFFAKLVVNDKPTIYKLLRI